MTRQRDALLILGVAVLVVIAAIVVLGGARRGADSDAAARPSASVTAATAPSGSAVPSATASVSPTAGRTYGYVTISETDRVAVRRERDASVVFEVMGRNPAVSADGRRVAYWRVTPGVGPTDLRVVDVRDPSSDRSVYLVATGQLGGAVLWANDGLGLLATTYSIETAGPPGGPPGSGVPARYDLLMLDLAMTPARAVPAAPTATRGFVYHPVAWDRPGRVATGVITGEGGFTRDYVIWNGNNASPMSTVPLGGTLAAFGVQASPDAKLVIGWELSQSPSVRVWPLDDPSNVRTIRAPSQFSRPFWRTSSDVIWTVGQRVQLIRVADGSAATVFTGGDQPIVAFAARPDGSGVVIEERLGGPGGTSKFFIVDLGTRQTADMWSRPGSALFVPMGIFLP